MSLAHDVSELGSVRPSSLLSPLTPPQPPQRHRFHLRRSRGADRLTHRWSSPRCGRRGVLGAVHVWRVLGAVGVWAAGRGEEDAGGAEGEFEGLDGSRISSFVVRNCICCRCFPFGSEQIRQR